MPRGKGLVRCPPAAIAHRLHVGHLLGALAVAASPKGAGMLTPGPLFDQGQTGTCHAHSLIGVVASATAGAPLPFVGSPRQLAACVYAEARAATLVAGAVVPPLQDTGANLQQDCDALAGWGLAPIQAPTSDGRYSDVENDPPDNVFPEADPAQLERVVQVSGEYSIPTGSSAPTAVALCIDAGVPVQVGFFCDSAFENLTADQVAQPPNTSDPNGGGHAVYLYGYRTAADGSYEFRLRNSWGSSWCDGGDCWVSSAWLIAAWELFPGAFRALGKAA